MPGRHSTTNHALFSLSHHMNTISSERYTLPPPLKPSAQETWIQQDSSLRFYPAIHRYYQNNSLIPFSVTGIASYDQSPFVKQKIASTTSSWQPKGDFCHLQLENFLLGRDVEYGDYEDYLKPLFAWDKWEKYKPRAVELRMASRDGFYAGSLDCLLTDGERWVLADLKTGNRKPDPQRQFGAYCQLLEQNYGIFVDVAVALWARPNQLELVVYREPQQCIDSWSDCLACFKRTLPDF